jgi:polyisoprenoid-binding protein YceI
MWSLAGRTEAISGPAEIRKLNPREAVLLHYAIESTARPEGITVRYLIETTGSNFSVQAFATGLLSSFAHNPTIVIPEFEGEVFLDPNDLENSSMRMLVHSAALTPAQDTPAKDREELNRRMHQEVLEDDSFSDIVYECSHVSASKIGEGQYWAAVNGELSFHGVTRAQPVSARISVNEETLKAQGEFSIRLSDFEIKPVSAVGGAVKLKDEVKFSFNINARKAV